MSDDRFGYGEIGMDTSRCADATAYAMMCKPKPTTNADRIRAMSDEELAEWLENHCYQYGWLSWLKQEVESDG